MSRLIKKIARIHNVSEREVRRELKLAISEGMKSTEPEARAFWNSFGGKTPSPEELIQRLALVVPAR